MVEAGASVEAGHPDSEYTDAGAGSATLGAELVVHVAVPTTEEISRLSSGQVLIGHRP